MTTARRLRTLLMAFLFVGTGFGAPLLDAVLFHQGEEPTRPHVEMRDNPACHGERCVIPLYQVTQGSTPAQVPNTVPAPSLVTSVDPVPPPAPETPRLPGSLRSRAPPTSLV